MTLLIHFVLGMVLSFIGSIPFGTINVATAETAIRQGFRAAVWVALGAALVEWIQAVLCLLFSGFIMDNPLVETVLTWASIPIFIGLGIYFLRRGRPQKAVLRETRAQGFMKGVVVSALNLLAIPYWVFYGTYLSSIGWVDLESKLHIGIFGAGVLCGTFLILLTYAKIGVLADARSNKVVRYLAPAAAGIFFVLAVVQICRLFF